jgi:hypothetical protein
VLVVLPPIPDLTLWNVPAGADFGLERLTGLIIPAIAARTRSEELGLLTRVIFDH